MKKRLLKLITLLMLTGASVYGQSTIGGTVTSAVDGAPMPGVSILLKGSSTGTFTDTDGKFKLELPAGTENILVVSFIGFTSQEVPVGAQTTLTIVMAEDAKTLNEVVVTALGIARESKTLVYATQSIKPSTLTEVRDPNNVLNSLQGKVVNAQINQGSGGVGSGARIVLRGNRSISGPNNALIVIDGVPINNTTGGAASSDFGSVQSSDGASNINPDDIESMTILRGASAAALYGSQAANGVILITTKKGGKEAIAVTVNSGVQFDRPFQLPNVQNKYGQGYSGVARNNVGDSWGAAMNGQGFTQTGDSVNSPYSPHKKNISDFFRTGVSLTNSIGIQGGSEKTQTYLSYTNKNTQGIIPLNNLISHNINLRITNQITAKFSTDAKITYISQNIYNRPRTGEENAPVIDIYQMPRSMPIGVAKHYETLNSLGQPTPTAWPSTLNSIYQNPYWINNRSSINEQRNRVIGLLSAKYKFTDWLSVTGRATLDKTIDNGDEAYSVGTILWVSQAGGYFSKTQTTRTDQWYDLILEGNNKISNDLKINYHLGTIWQDNAEKVEQQTANGLNYTNKFNLNFATTPSLNSQASQQRTESVFGQFNLAYKEALFVDGSLREEWNSALPSPYRFSYYSIGASAIISDLVTLPSQISYLKLSVSDAQVGNGGQFGLLKTQFNYNQGAGNGTFSRGTTQPFLTLKPEITTSYEAGLEARFIDNRVGFQFTFYNSTSVNELLQISLPPATGYANKYINAGSIRNRGIELIINGTPIKSGDFSWDVAFNLGMNRNHVVKIDPNLSKVYLGGSSFARTASPYVAVGGSYGDMEAYQWAKDSQGRHIVNADGLPVETALPGYVGNFSPRALLGLTNTINYKKFSFRLLTDGRIGGTIIDGTEMNLAFSGISKVTEQHRDDTNWSLGGVTADGTANTKTITSQQFWAAGSTITSGKRYGVGEFFAYDATNFRVRELSIGYSLPIPSGIGIKSARISFVARNLFWLYRGYSKLDIPGLAKRKLQIDPDMSLGNGNFQGIQLASMPSTRSLGFNLKLVF